MRTISEMASTVKGKLPSRIIEVPSGRSKPYLLMDGLRGGTHVHTEDTHLPSVREQDTVVIADGSKSGFAVHGVAGVLGSTLLGFSAREGTHPSFLFHLVSSLFPFLNSATTGTAIPHLDQDLLLRLPLGVPEQLDEQAAIARILDAVDTALERTRAAVERAREVKRALVQRVLPEGLRGEPHRKTAIGFIPRSWHVAPVSSVVGSFQYGLSVPMEQKGKLPILRMGNIQNGEIVLADLKYVNLPEKVVSPYFLKRGDVLFNRTNSQEWVGKVGVYRYDTPAVFASYLIRLVSDGTKVDSYYLGHVLGSYSAQCRIKRYATPGVQQVNINATNLGKVLIPLPIGENGLREQRDIAALLEAADAVVRSYEPVLAAQQSLKASLAHDLLTGRVRVRHEAKAAAS